MNNARSEAHYGTLINYKPRVYAGRITLFRTRAQPLFSSHAPDKGWGPLARLGVEVRIVPGNHNLIYDEQDVRSLAKQMRRAIDAAEAMATPAPKVKAATTTGQTSLLESSF